MYLQMFYPVILNKLFFSEKKNCKKQIIYGFIRFVCSIINGIQFSWVASKFGYARHVRILDMRSIMWSGVTLRKNARNSAFVQKFLRTICARLIQWNFARIFRPYYLSLSRGKRSRQNGTSWHIATRTITVATRQLGDNNMIIVVTWHKNSIRLLAPITRHGVSQPQSRKGCGTSRSVFLSHFPPRIIIRIRRFARLRHPVWHVWCQTLTHSVK